MAIIAVCSFIFVILVWVSNIILEKNICKFSTIRLWLITTLLAKKGPLYTPSAPSKIQPGC